MMLSRYLRPALGAVVFVVLAVAWYWFEHRSRPEPKQSAGNALVVVAKSANAPLDALNGAARFPLGPRPVVFNGGWATPLCD